MGHDEGAGRADGNADGDADEDADGDADGDADADADGHADGEQTGSRTQAAGGRSCTEALCRIVNTLALASNVVASSAAHKASATGLI